MDLGIVTTGGTIAGELDRGVIKVGASDDLRSFISQSTDISSVKSISAFDLMSENFAPKHWLRIADCARDLLEQGANSILVLHGTDTASYTSAALASLLSDVEAPISVTGSNIPFSEPGSDAMNNINQAVAWLREAPNGVFLTFSGSAAGQGYAHIGTLVRKYHAGGQAFHTVTGTPYAKIQPSGEVEHLFTAKITGKVDPIPFDRLGSALLVRVYPGIDFFAIRESALRNSAQAIVFELYPSFTAPNGNDEFSELITWANSKNIVIFGCVAEPPTSKVSYYESNFAAEKSGIVQLSNTTPEVAYVRATLSGDVSGQELINRVIQPTPTDALYLGGLQR